MFIFPAEGRFAVQAPELVQRSLSMTDFVTQVGKLISAPICANPMALRFFSGFIRSLNTSKKCVTSRFGHISEMKKMLKQHKVLLWENRKASECKFGF